MNGRNRGHSSLLDIPDFECNNYYHGKLMTSRDFFAEQCYFNEKRWLINRAIAGWGVVCGLKVVKDANDEKKVKILPGLAIDCCGREMLVRHEISCEVKPTEEEWQRSAIQSSAEVFFVGLEYWACKTETMKIAPAACTEGDKYEFNRIRDYYKPCVLRPDEVVDYPPGWCPLTENVSQDLRQYLCEKMMEDYPRCPELPRNHAVILAKVTLDDSGKVQEIELCPYRWQVYSNKTLFDLINCYHGDLPHITGINWFKFHSGEMGWEEFIEMIKRESGHDGPGLQVTFDKVVEGVNEHTFLFLVKFIETEGEYIHNWYIPGEISPTSSPMTVAFKVKTSWYKDMVNYSFIHGGADFQVVLRGDHIVDKKTKRALDANFRGGVLPSGNGAQGGDFVSWFRVKAKPL